MKLTILGSGSPEAYARRASSGYLVEIGKDKILLDCGGGVFDNLLRAGLLPSDITHLVFSHLHSDHMMDYGRLIHAAWEEGGAPVQVYGPAPLAKINHGFFGSGGVLEHDIDARVNFEPSQDVWVARGGTLPRPRPAPIVREVDPGFSIAGEGWTLTSCEVPHAQPHLTCMALALEADGKKFVYSGDAGDVPALRALSQDADLLVHWCYRLDGEPAHPKMQALTPTPGEIAAMACDCNARALILSHFRKHMDAEGCHAAAMAHAKAAFSGEVTIAEDLMTFDV